jgi:ABC-type multidrug transport system fused ATPase/permease subunit
MQRAITPAEVLEATAAPVASRYRRVAEPLLPGSLLGFVWRISARHQIALSCLSVVVFLMSAAPLEIQRRIVNDAFRGGQLRPIVTLALLYLAVAGTEGLIKLGMNVYRSWVSENAVRTLRLDVEELLFGLQPAAAAPGVLGVETSMMLNEVEPIGGFVGISLSEPLLQGGLLVTVFGYMAIIQPTMALVAMAVFLPQAVFVPLMQRAINRRVAQRVTALRAVSTAMVGMRSAAAPELAPESLINQIFTLNMGIFKLKFSMNFLMNLLHHAGTAAVLAVGGWYVVQGFTEVGTVVAFVSGLSKVNDPWGDIVNWFRDLTATATKYGLIALAVNTLAQEPPRAGEPVEAVE